ncbi:carbohydrate ABC transporter permease [Methylobacterium frigidaeris]|uniref:Inner membrane ABC transporter permease protein YcjP n=1 Tax=Methylobacterium frigidaeris TaxID=2038277 RepID=A0AA37M8C7_9HYPH|nr:carbohydrate ABC transporter permease [Methylobacterium frigidaeris]GJD65741.1 Inner membrane ABC transporter permease protein YcjP [Methylobacterium frigidaeris]
MTRPRRPFVALILGLMLLYNLAPFYWVVSSSLKPPLEVIDFPATLWPRQATVEAYAKIWQQEGFPVYFLNSLITSSGTALISSLVGVFAAYGFSRFAFRGKLALMAILLTSQMLPGVLLVGPYFELLSRAGLYDTRLGLVLALSTITLPFSVWMLKGYIDTIPPEIDQAAMLDGASRLQVLTKVILPNVMPGLVATVTFAFLLAWGDVLWALCLIQDQARQPMTLGVLKMFGQFRVEWAQIMAATLVATAIPSCLYVLLQRYLVQGFAGSAIKD